MAQYLENYDLGFFRESEENMRGLWAMIGQMGRPISGYSGGKYFNYHMGDVQMILRAERNGTELTAVGFDVHSVGSCVWDVRIISTSKCADADSLEKRCLVKRHADRNGLTVINIVNADVLPSFEEDTHLRLQMIAFSTDFHYHANEEEYDLSCPKDENGKRWGLGEGTIFPSGFMRNHSITSDREKVIEDNELDQYVLLRAKVKKLYVGMFELGGEKLEQYIRCILDTQFGDLEFVHTYDQVPEAERDHLKEGSTVSGVFVLSGDAAIYEYEHGIVRDVENNLLLLRSALISGDTQRLKAILLPDTIYQADTVHQSFAGTEQIIERLSFIHENINRRVYAHLATIRSVDAPKEEALYPEDTRCIVLAYDEPKNYVSIVFIDTNDEGMVTRILTTSDSRYHFRLDIEPEESE